MTELTSKSGWREFVDHAMTDPSCPQWYGRDFRIVYQLQLPVAEVVHRFWRQMDISLDDLVILVPREGWDDCPEGGYLNGVRLKAANIDWPVVGMEVTRR